MNWLYSLLSNIPGVGLFLKTISLWSSVLTGVGKAAGAVVGFATWAKSGVLGILTTGALIGTGTTLYRDPDFFTSRFERFVVWSCNQAEWTYKSAIDLSKQSVDYASTKTLSLYETLKAFVFGYSSVKGHSSTPPWLPPVQETNIYSPFASIRASYQEIMVWKPVPLRLHYMQEKGSPFIRPYVSGQDILPPLEEAESLTSFQKFVQMLDSTVYHKMSAVQNSYLDQTIILPSWLRDYYIENALHINELQTEYAEISAEVDGSIPYLYYAGTLLACLTIFQKVVPILSAYVRAVFDISIRNRQERGARRAWEEEVKKRYGATKPSPYELAKAESDFFREYRQRIGETIKLGKPAEDKQPERAQVVTLHWLADLGAVLKNVRLFWPSLAYSAFLVRTGYRITRLVSLRAEIDRKHEGIIRYIIMFYGDILISAQNELTLHRCQEILLAKANYINWGWLYLSSTNHATVAIGVIWGVILLKSWVSLSSGFSSVFNPLQTLLSGSKMAPAVGATAAGAAGIANGDSNLLAGNKSLAEDVTKRWEKIQGGASSEHLIDPSPTFRTSLPGETPVSLPDDPEAKGLTRMLEVMESVGGALKGAFMRPSSKEPMSDLIHESSPSSTVNRLIEMRSEDEMATITKDVGLQMIQKLGSEEGIKEVEVMKEVGQAMVTGAKQIFDTINLINSVSA